MCPIQGSAPNSAAHAADRHQWGTRDLPRSRALSEGGQEGVGPEMHVLPKHSAVQATHAGPLFFGIEPHCLSNRPLDPVEVVRVDQQGSSQLSCRTGELAQDQATGQIAPARHILLRHEIHAVPERGDEHDVGGQIERNQFIERNILVQVVDSGVSDTTKIAVCLADQVFKVLPFTLVVGIYLSAGNGDLDHYVSRGRERSVVEELGNRFDAVLDALRVVQPVDSEQDHFGIAQVHSELACPVPDPGIGCATCELGAIHRNGESPHPDTASLVLDGMVIATCSRYPSSESGEIRSCTGHLKADEVGSQQTVKYLSPPWKLEEQLAWWKGNVQEEPDPDVRPELTQHPGHELQLVVVDPDRASSSRGGGSH